jgi:hypothetical protein
MSSQDLSQSSFICRSCRKPNPIDQFKCGNCGLSILPWHLRFCTNENCKAIFFIGRTECTACKVPYKVGIRGYLAIAYFSLTNPFFKTTESREQFLTQLTIYMGVVLGIAFSSYVKGDQSEIISIVDFLGACIVSFVVLPSVFQDGIILPDAPFLARFGVAVQRGVFSDLVISAVEKTLL